jgi:hypothetical protein
MKMRQVMCLKLPLRVCPCDNELVKRIMFWKEVLASDHGQILCSNTFCFIS